MTIQNLYHQNVKIGEAFPSPFVIKRVTAPRIYAEHEINSAICGGRT